MENSFDVLEDKIRRTAELVKKLRKENRALEEDLGKARARTAEAEKRLAGLEREAGAGAAHGKELDSAKGELKSLRHEREEIRKRIARLVEVLDGLD